MLIYIHKLCVLVPRRIWMCECAIYKKFDLIADVGSGLSVIAKASVGGWNVLKFDSLRRCDDLFVLY